MAKTIYKLILIVLFIFINISSVFAQRNDLAMWISADVGKTWAGKWQTILTAEFRARDDISEVDLYSGGLFVNYLQSKRLKIGFGYEYFANHTTGGKFESEHRMMLQSNFQHSFLNFRFAWRSSLMDAFYSFSDPNFGMRNRIKVDYSIPRSMLKPFAYTEFYHVFDHGIHHHKNRYGCGLSYSMKKQQQLDIYYMAEDYYSKSFTRHVIGVGYAISL